MQGSRFSLEDVRIIMSEDHRNNTARHLGRHPFDVSTENLIQHYLEHHIPMDVHTFTVGEMQQVMHGSDLDPLFV